MSRDHKKRLKRKRRAARLRRLRIKSKAAKVQGVRPPVEIASPPS